MGIGHDIARRLIEFGHQLREAEVRILERHKCMSLGWALQKEATNLNLFCDAHDKLVEVKKTQDDLLDAQRQRIIQLETKLQQYELLIQQLQQENDLLKKTQELLDKPRNK